MDLELGLPLFSFRLENHVILVVFMLVTNIMFCHDTNLEKCENPKIITYPFGRVIPMCQWQLGVDTTLKEDGFHSKNLSFASYCCLLVAYNTKNILSSSTNKMKTRSSSNIFSKGSNLNIVTICNLKIELEYQR
jgi:hypothetical protein